MTACIPWRGTFSGRYPTLRGRRAHRVMYESQRGPIPRGYVIHHACENPACVNPDHLRAITPSDHARIHRAWEASNAVARARTNCRYGHPLDGRSSTTGRRFCRECRREDVRQRYRRNRRLSPMLPQSPAFAQAMEADDSPVEPPAALESDGKA